MGELDGFEAFVACVEEGSLAAAGRRLGLSRPTISRKLSRLEASLGVRLMHRSTRRTALTIAGEEFYKRARSVVGEAAEARLAVAVSDGVPRGLVRLSVPGVPPAISRLLLSFLDRYPQVQLEIVAAARYVDMVSEGFDVALRGGTLDEDGLIARVLLDENHGVAASQAYLDGAPPLTSPEDLANHDCIRSFRRGTVVQTHWPLTDGGTVAVSGRLASNDLNLVESAIREGRGVGLLPWMPADLVHVLSDTVGVRGRLAVVYPERRLMAPAVRALVDHLVEHRHRLVEP